MFPLAISKKEEKTVGLAVLVIFVHLEYSLLILSRVKVLLVDFTFQIQPFLYYYLLMHMNYAMYACIYPLAIYVLRKLNVLILFL
jgi:hypothetical protein